MLRNLRDHGDREDGFTLIELMIVVLIIAILIAIAVPTFLGARQRAQDRAAQSSLRNTLTAAKTAYTDSGDYSKSRSAALAAVEPSLTYVAGNIVSTGPTNVSARVSSVVASPPDRQVFSAAVLSKSGTCFWIRDQATGALAGTTYGSTSDQTKCTGNDARSATAPSW